MTCKCGQPFTERRQDDVMQINHGNRHGVIWMQNNETYIRRGIYNSPKSPQHRHVGTFKTLVEAKIALTKALARARH